MLTLWGPRARHHTGLKAVVCAPKRVGATSSSVYTKCFGLLLLTSKVLLECIKFLANLKKTKKKQRNGTRRQFARKPILFGNTTKIERVHSVLVWLVVSKQTKALCTRSSFSTTKQNKTLCTHWNLLAAAASPQGRALGADSRLQHRVMARSKTPQGEHGPWAERIGQCFSTGYWILSLFNVVHV